MPVTKNYVSDNAPHNDTYLRIESIWEGKGIAIEVRSKGDDELFAMACFTPETATEFAQDLFIEADKARLTKESKTGNHNPQ